MFEFLTLLVFGVMALRATGGKRALALLLIALLVVMDAGAHAMVVA